MSVMDISLGARLSVSQGSTSSGKEQNSVAQHRDPVKRYQQDDAFRASRNTAILELTNKTIDRLDFSLSDSDLVKLKTLIEEIGGIENLAVPVKEAYIGAMERHDANEAREKRENAELAQAIQNSKDTHDEHQLQLAIEQSLISFHKEESARLADMGRLNDLTLHSLPQAKTLHSLPQAKTPHSLPQAKTVSSDLPISTYSQNKEVTTSGRGDDCGYHSLAIGILGYAQQNPAKVISAFNEIGFNVGGLTGEISKDQLSLGQAIKQYFIGNHHKTTWIDNQLKELKLEDSGLKKEIRNSLEAPSFISADYLNFMAHKLGFSVRLNGAEEQVEGDNIRIFNKNSVHYTGTMPADVVDTYKTLLDQFETKIITEANNQLGRLRSCYELEEPRSMFTFLPGFVTAY